MKFLILFLISFTASANYLPKSKIGQDTNGIKVFMKKQRCEAEYSEPCIKFKENFSYSEIKPEKYLKEQSEVCSGETDCIEKMDSLNCLSDGFYKIRTEAHDEVYCTKFVPERVKENAALKAIFKAEKKALKDAEQVLKDERKAIKVTIKDTGWDSLTPKKREKIILYLLRNL